MGGLHQIADRNINTAVNQLVDNSGDYKSYNANSFSSLAPQFQVVSDLAYVTGRFHTWKIRHEVSFGTTGYRFASWSPVNGGPAKAHGLLCTAQGVCEASIANPADRRHTPGRPLFLYEDQPVNRHLRIEHHPAAGNQLR